MITDVDDHCLAMPCFCNKERSQISNLCLICLILISYSYSGSPYNLICTSSQGYLWHKSATYLLPRAGRCINKRCLRTAAACNKSVLPKSSPSPASKICFSSEGHQLRNSLHDLVVTIIIRQYVTHWQSAINTIAILAVIVFITTLYRYSSGDVNFPLGDVN